jgi:phosphonate transport system substrate-binding protein
VKHRRILTLLAALLSVVLVTAACGGDPSDQQPANGLPKTLHVGVVPNVSPDKQRAQYEPFRKYLADRLGIDVQLFVATDYSGVVAALVSKKVDLAYLGGLTYVQAAEQSPVTPIVTEVDEETGTPKYPSAIIVKAGSRFTSTKQVVDAHARFAFGDPSSTSGSLFPRVMLTQAGARCDRLRITQCPPLASVTFTGGHDATAQAVYNGSVDAGGIELRILHRLEKQGTIPKGALRVIETTQVMGYPWVTRAELNDQARKTLTDSFTSLTDPTLLDLLRAKSYVTVTDADYADVRANASRLGLLTPGR